jgi:hypothetical protein
VSALLLWQAFDKGLPPPRGGSWVYSTTCMHDSPRMGRGRAHSGGVTIGYCYGVSAHMCTCLLKKLVPGLHMYHDVATCDLLLWQAGTKDHGGGGGDRQVQLVLQHTLNA